MQGKGSRLNLGKVYLGVGAAILVVAFATACSRKQPAEATADAAMKPAAASTPQVIDVSTAAAINRNLQRSVEVVGSLAADEEVVVSAQVAGELSQLNVDFGSYVSQGQVIAVIDQRDAKLKVEQAEATLKQTLARLGMKEGEKFDPHQNADVRVAKASLDWAQMDLDRNTKLIENGDISRSIYDQAVTQHNLANARYQAALDSVNQQLAIIEQQKSALALAKKAVTDTVVRAPISGAVKEKLSNRGSYLAVGGKIVSLVKINPLRLRADIPESFSAAVSKGQTMTLTVEALAGRTFSGRVVRISPSLNEQTRALTVEAEVNNTGNLLRPGMFAKSQLITAKNSSAVMVPAKAVLTAAGLSKVFVIENGKAIERIVKTGLADGDLIEVTEGVLTGETIATSNLDKLQSGSLVSSK
ncbi:MAG: efflux RND transporter periplasmic adaptor subunit [Acidobacteria bacterium]|nr:efflux RND transporter periplasmic adaptor subunit [Acidobacteriota bacterium]